MNQAKTYAVFFLLLVSVVPTVLAGDGSLTGAEVALHLTPHAAKTDYCLPESQGGFAPDLTPCSQYTTAGLTGTSYNVYLTVAAPGSFTSHPGIGGLSCGILYQSGALGGSTQHDGIGVDVIAWQLCATGTECRSSPSGLPEDVWPASGGGNIMVFDVPQDCQLSTVPGYESEGVVALFGALYVYAYSPDVLSLTPNYYTSANPSLQVGDCESFETDLPFSNTGSVAFTADGSVEGNNPCDHLGSGCSVSPALIDLGSMEVGDTASAQFTVGNSAAGDLVFELDCTCPDYTVLEGTGPFTLAPDEDTTLTVRLVPTTPGTTYCTIDTGTECEPVWVTAEVCTTYTDCVVAPPSLDFNFVQPGSYTDKAFNISNRGTVKLVGQVSEACSDFSVISGGGVFSLDPLETQTVTVRFAPTSSGYKECQIDVTGGCSSVAVSGYGTTLPEGGLDDAVFAFHASPHVLKGDPCPVAPQVPCSDYTTRWPLQTGCDLYLMVARGDDPGIAGLSCGILYEGGALGAPTLQNGLGVDVFDWAFCASGLEIPSGYGNDPADEWPASGGGNRITWDTWFDCQTTEYGSDGIHAVAGVFYIYAYSDDQFQITPNYNAISGPELQVRDCNAALYDLDYPQEVAICAFGNAVDYNPCTDAVPVRLLSFTALRVDAGAEVRWVVAGADGGHAGFEVYRGLTVEDRVPVSDGLLSGRESYAFVDDDPPSVAVSYWLAERSRAGDVTWHGPVELEAASVPAPGFALHRASPNPFLGATKIAFRTGADGPVTVRIFDTAGREVARPFSGSMPAGDHEVAWDGRDDAGRRLSAGVYLYRIETAEGGGAGKVVLIR